MLFNSYEFLFVFLPIVFLFYFLFNRCGWIPFSKGWLVVSSLFFYSWWNVLYLPLILASMAMNFLIGRALVSDRKPEIRKALVTLGIIGNVALLGYFKYSDFFIGTVNTLLDANWALLELTLPLAISFFTFQQIAFLVDAYRGETKDYRLLDYALFVTFFPQLIAGPIVHHKEMMPQFEDVQNRRINPKHMAMGIFIFSIGLFKKVAIADTFAKTATNGFDVRESLTFLEAWLVSYSYTFQLYFDFSGYADMAIGLALLFNISLPVNFLSPYKSLSIQEFWRRWHMTLGRFLTHYLYIPLGGNRLGKVRTYVNLFIVFFVSGIWHGAGWTFVLWGVLHGVAMIINRLWQQLGFKMNKVLAWFLTFQFVNFAWVFFRAESFEDALKVLKGMAGLSGFALPEWAAEQMAWLTFAAEFQMAEAGFYWGLGLTAMAFIVVLTWRNSIERMEAFKPNFYHVLICAAALIYSILSLSEVSEFLYFNF
ncbi:MBOAT family O-acyltransferase [Alkalihalophilus marmarensis]|uniref:Acetyltransferase n=1 Tax=Alkalihalophilus marmarensis DSM 21297 TaxID=1188261 RepID=U6SKA1_9BACI|nr:MBOAT family protein [Alkalihalophilus marmarensis]ERN52013.1 acetyltransferase [Alkalihalophilus marmarensis DSM 21297]